MTKLTKIAFCLLFGIMLCCKKDSAQPIIESSTPVLSKISSIDQDNSFVDSDGKLFFPWGFNYTNPQIIGLLEDNWHIENTWQVIEQDFSEMKAYKANILRIHLQFNKFMLDSETPNQDALQKLLRLVKIAEEKGLYLDVTGLASYRKSDSPEWYDNLTDAQRWQAQAVFWKSVAATLKDSPAIFVYNLMNEPVVSVGCDDIAECDWLPGDGFGGFHFIQNITRDTGLPVGETLREWIGTMKSAIRSEDNDTFITVGFLGLGPVQDFSVDLDITSVHQYPVPGQEQEAIDYIKNNQGDKPLILEETSNLWGEIDDFRIFFDGISGNYNGLFGHYFGKTLEEMTLTGSNTDRKHKEFIEFFIANNPN